MKTIQLLLSITLLPISHLVIADTYKCMRGGRPIYQATPCELNSNKGKLDIKVETPEEKALAREKLEAIRTEYDAEKTAEQQSEKSAKPNNTQQSSAAQTSPVRTMYTYGSPLNNPPTPDTPQASDQPVKIIYPWGDPRHQPAD